MAETYCGKSCAECVAKEQMSCPGCRVGPGREVGGDCDLARCCRTKGHDTCETCSFKVNCGTLRSRDWMPDNRRRKLQLEAEAKAETARRAPILGKWLWILFWMCIGSEVLGLLNMIPELKIPVMIIAAAINIAYCLILLKMSSIEPRYRITGLCTIAGWALSAASDLLFGDSKAVLPMLFNLPAAIVGFIGEYQEFTAHGNVLWGIDNELSDKWNMLWKLYIGCYGAMFGSIILGFLMPVIAVIILVVSIIAFLVVHFVRLVYLYRSAKIFRDFKSE